MLRRPQQRFPPPALGALDTNSEGNLASMKTHSICTLIERLGESGARVRTGLP